MYRIVYKTHYKMQYMNGRSALFIENHAFVFSPFFASSYCGSIIIPHISVPFKSNLRACAHCLRSSLHIYIYICVCVCMCVFIWVLDLREIVMLSNRLCIACSHAFDLNGKNRGSERNCCTHSYICTQI